jgi:tRNA C32,U32 (ribose-2'-O)-methylase TrmJ
MNIAMSVGIFCYELSKSLRPAPEPKDPAPGALIDRLHEYARSVLTEIGYLHEPGADHMFNEMKALAGRTMLTRRDASTLLAILRQVNWRIGHPKHGEKL